MNPENDENFEIDMIRFEIRQRHLMDELAMKRIQVENQKKELDQAHLKIYELTRAAETSKNVLEENERNLNLVCKNSKFFENELNTRRNSVTKAKIQYESTVADKNSLQEQLQNEKIKNYDLLRELNEMKAKHHCDVTYQNEIMAQDAKVREKMTAIIGTVQKFQSSYAEILELSNYIKSCEDMEKAVNFYRSEFYKCKQKYVDLEKKYIVVKAAWKKFEMLTKERNEIFKPNKETQIILTQWTKEKAISNETNKMQEEVIENLSKSLKLEKEANSKIFIKEAELEEKIVQLQKENDEYKIKLGQIKKEPEQEIINCENQTIKDEASKTLEDK